MKKIKLVLSGSGTKFPVFVGALKRLKESGYEIEEICGTSGGAIVGAGLASGYSIEEMISLCQSFLPKATSMLDPSLWTLYWRWGLISGDKIEKELRHHLPLKFKDTKIPLRVIAVNYDRQSEDEPFHVFSTQLSPDMDICRAVRASMSIPIIFATVKIDGDKYIDGGMAANFPVDIYGPGATNVVGIHFSPEKKNVPPKKRPKGFKGMIQFVFDMVDIFMNALARESIEDAPNARVITLKTKYGGLDFFLTKKQVNDMISEGYRSMDQALKNKPL